MCPLTTPPPPWGTIGGIAYIAKVADYPPHLGTVKPHLGTRPAGMQPTPRTQARKVKRGRHPSPPRVQATVQFTYVTVKY